MRAGTTVQTAAQSVELVSKRNALRRRITTARAVQVVYMPCVVALIAPTQTTSAVPQPPSTSTLPEEEPLFFPHGLTPGQLNTCVPSLAAMEERLRDAQMYDSLNTLRKHLHDRARIAIFKRLNVRHQRPNTRARQALDTNEAKSQTVAEKYRAARLAKIALTGPGEWENKWRHLVAGDIRTMLAEDDPVNSTASMPPTVPSEGRRKTSWIWMGAGQAPGDDASGLQDGM